jgi:membrane associated rhomboid family serine protease
MSDRSRASEAERILGDARSALFVMAGVMAFIWLVQLINWLAHYWLSKHFGIVARDGGRLPDIFAAPFLHWSFAHIEANSAPLFFLGFLAAYRGLARFAAVTVLVVVASGMGSWLFEPAHTVGAGASGVVFGYFAYVVLRGIVERHLVDVVVGLVVAVSYWSILRGVLPADPHIGWQAHLFGLIGGIVAALLLPQQRRRHSAAPAPRLGLPTTPGDRPGEYPGDHPRTALHQELHDLGLD